MEHIISTSFWQGALEPVLIALLFGIAGINKHPVTSKTDIVIDVYSAALMGLLTHICFCILGEEQNMRYLELGIAAVSGLSGSLTIKKLYDLSSNLYIKLIKGVLSK